MGGSVGSGGNGDSEGNGPGGTDGGAPGPGGRGGSSSGSSSGSSGGVGSNGDGGGRAAGNGGMGSSSASGGVSGQGGGGYGGAVGHGVDSAHGGSSSVGSDGGVSGLGGYADAADAAEEAFGGWQAEADTQMGPENTAYGANEHSNNYGGTFGDNLAASPISMAQATDNAQQAIASNAKPGLLGTLASTALTAFGQPALGYGVNAMARGYNASQQAEAHNAEFGTSVNEGLASNVGQQATGMAAGIVGGKVGGQMGAKAGASIGGMPGAIAGGLIGSMGLGNAARGAAMSAGSNQGQGTSGPAGQSPGGNERDNANLTDPTDIARARRQSEINQRAEQATMPIATNGNQSYGYQPQSQSSYTFDSLADTATSIFS